MTPTQPIENTLKEYPLRLDDMTFTPIERQNILGDGIAYVALTDVMGDDRTPARTARTSFRNSDKERSEEQDAKLTRYLITHHHNTP